MWLLEDVDVLVTRIIPILTIRFRLSQTYLIKLETHNVVRVFSFVTFMHLCESIHCLISATFKSSSFCFSVSNCCVPVCERAAGMHTRYVV